MIMVVIVVVVVVMAVVSRITYFCKTMTDIILGGCTLWNSILVYLSVKHVE
jgi:hypothetical protein